ncbi:MAG: PLDc N-terminal domain-containing protein [Candidatus Desulfatibia sp.]|uniref:PLDc N-terminal domain-containing protein n=1 Tax=Candidatus Desulfatibia sp. TaxID=3101189 RepID=UPI002F302E58
MDIATIFFWIKIGVVFYIFTIAAIIDIARKDFGSIGMQALWAFIALIPFIGWLIYLVVGYRKGRKPDPHIS